MAGAWRTHWSLLIRVSLPQFQVFTANLSSYFFRFMFIVLEPVSYKYCIILVIFIINRLEIDTDKLIFPLLLPFLSFLIVQLGTQAKENCFPCYLWVLEPPWQRSYAVWAPSMFQRQMLASYGWLMNMKRVISIASPTLALSFCY